MASMNKIERQLPGSDLLKTFVVIAECGNLTRAAEQLHKTQSAISVQLRKLEETLDATLFERQARGMVLSASGEKLLPAARRTLAELERITRLFDSPLAGRIRVGIPDDYDDTILERALAAFALRNPDVEIVATSGCTSRFPKAIRGGRLDIAVCSSAEPLDGIPLSSEPVVWAGVDAPDPSAPVPLAILDRNCWWRAMPTEALDEMGREWRVAYRSSSFTSLRAAIRSGLAVGVLPHRSVDGAMRLLTREDGLPPLPPALRTFMISPKAPLSLSAAMIDAIRDAVRNPAGPASGQARG